MALYRTAQFSLPPLNIERMKMQFRLPRVTVIDGNLENAAMAAGAVIRYGSQCIRREYRRCNRRAYSAATATDR